MRFTKLYKKLIYLPANKLISSLTNRLIISFLKRCFIVTMTIFASTSVCAQVTQTYIKTTGTSNPITSTGGAQLKEVDNVIVGWTKVVMPAGGLANANKWSNSISFPTAPTLFSFKFFGESVTNFKVSLNGLLTFCSPLPTLLPPVGNNTNLPATALSFPNKTISCLWDQYTISPPIGTNDFIYTRTIGSAPNRQFWVKWNSFEIGNPIVNDASFAIVFEESTNAIYIVDMYRGTPIATNLSATIGLQYDNRYYYNQAVKASLTSATTAYINNNFVKFSPTPITDDSLLYTNADLSASSASGTKRTLVLTPNNSCLLTSVKSCKLFASLNLGEDYEYGNKGVFADSTGADLAVNGYDVSGALLFSGMAHLVINQTSVEKLYELDITSYYYSAVSTTPGFSVPNISYITAGISGFIQSVNVDVQNDVKLLVWTETKYDVILSATSSPTITLNVVDPTISPVQFSWSSACAGVPKYEFQLMRLYNEGGEDYYSDINKAWGTIDWANALSLIVEKGAQSLALHLTEGTGYYAWRVRPIGNYYEGGAANDKNWGAWSQGRQQGATYNLDGSETLGAGTFYYNQFENGLNWIYNRVFTENNKISENMTYADGVGRVKQTQHHLQSVDEILISQQLYDYAGRPALKTMAGPVDRSNFDYQELFVTSDVSGSKLYRAKDFDSPTTYNNPSEIKGGELTAYYSDNNIDTRIPNAEGYPFSRSLYYADGTNRPKEISTPGALFQIGNTSSGDNRTIKIYYSAVADAELIRIFGDDAPVDTSVYKSIQVDPNQVITVTYHTVDGKVIATCLADGGDNELLDGLENEPFVVEDVIDNDDVSSGTNTYTKEKTVMINQQDVDFWVTYEITPAEIEASCGTYCKTCDYNVYGYIKEDGVVIKETSITIPAAACESGTTYSFSLEATTKVASYTAGRSISVKNDDPTSVANNTYLENHQDTMAAIMDEHLAESFDEMYEFLEASDIEGFYDYLVAQGFATSNQIVEGNTISVTTECCSVDIPVSVCPPHPCDNGTPDFEALLYNMWEHKYGNAFQNYSNFSSVFNYPDNGTFTAASLEITSNGNFVPTICPGFSSFIFRIEYTGADGSPKIFNLGDDVICFIDPLTNTSTPSEITDAIINALDAEFEAVYGTGKQYWPYTYTKSGFPFQNKIEFKPNLFGSATGFGFSGVMKGTVVLYSSFNDFLVNSNNIGINNNNNEFNYSPDAIGEFPFGIGAFNELIDNMIEDGYPCDTLYDIWYTLCNSLESLAPNNIVETFLKTAHTMYGKAAPVNQYGDDAHPGYLSHAHKVIKYKAGDCPDCETQYNYKAMTASDALDDIRTEADSLKTWFQFYACTQTCGGSLNGTLSELGFPIDDCDGTDDIACAEDLVATIKDSCYSLCDSRGSSFEDAIREEYAAEGLFITEEEIMCLVDALVEECRSGCGLTIYTHWADVPGDGLPVPVEVLDSVGNTLEIKAMQESLTYSFDIRIPTDSTCADMGYEHIAGNGIYAYEAVEDIVVEELNVYLNAFLDSSINNDTIYGNYIALAVNQIYNKYGFVAEPYLCAYTGLIGQLFTPFPVDENSYFYTDGSGNVYLNYCKTYMEALAIYTGEINSICIEDTSVGLMYLGECDTYWECDPICFKWIYPVVSGVPDTVEMQTCEESTAEFLMSELERQKQECKDLYVTNIGEVYESTCADPKNIDDVLTMGYTLGYFHYTLFYYDRGGNLVKTVPPMGVDETNDSREDSPNHTYKTTYKYNSRKQMVAKNTPDGGITKYYYNDLGQLRFSQNAKQLASKTKKYSYLKYDGLGRVYEAGQANICNTCPITSPADLTAKVNTINVPASGGQEKTFTVYTTPSTVVYTDADGVSHPQEFLNNRISYVYNDEDGDLADTTDQNYIYYSYDAHGNVKWLIKSVAGLSNKQIGFEYDIISGKITEVKYQQNQSDQYYYKYKYDADNRLTQVQTSRNGKIYDTDATYEYYAHGPLERVVLGEDKVQGLDYLYTIQGWLKAINHPQLGSGYDAGQDGEEGTANEKIPADAFGMVLNYYNGDFKRTGSVYNNSESSSSGSLLEKLNASHGTSDYKSYYNGFISNTISNNAATVTNHAGEPMVGMYLYDEIGRLTQSTIDFFSGSNWLGKTGITSDYYEHFEYDANGNIIGVERNGYTE